MSSELIRVSALAPLLPLAAASPESVERQVVAVLVQLILIILAARLFAIGFRKMGQPAVVGEILAGLILGPSIFKHVPALTPVWRSIFEPTDPSPEIARALASVPAVFGALSQLGLIFLLFLIGLEFDFSHLKTNNRSAIAISTMGVMAPFGLGYGLAAIMHRSLALAAQGIEFHGFALFMGTAMSITAIPILGRIMMELNITRSRLGAITITAAAIDDATGWILLATVSAIVKTHFQPWQTLKMLLLSIGFAVLMVWVVRPVLKCWARRSIRSGRMSLNALATLFVLIFLCAIATSLIGIFAIFGAFILGAVLSDEHEFRQVVADQLRNFVTVFFLPIFFTYTGLRTDVGTLGSATLWGFAAAVSGAAILGKFGGCALAARLTGFSGRESTCIGVMMNTRALMELIVINVGGSLGVIPDSVFCMLVLMALLTTVMTSPILLGVMKGTELEPLIAQSSFRSGED